jgi:predicted MFS family arabinose efflux permease
LFVTQQKEHKIVRQTDDPVSKVSRPNTRAWWTLIALTLLAVIDYADRALIGAVAEAIKADFSLSDTQLGVLMGIGFTLPRILLSVPVGRLADRFNRRNIIAISAFVLALSNIAFGLARNFLQLLFARAIFGASTAGAAIPAMSMIADLFPLRIRGKAMSVWHLCGTAGWAAGAAAAAIGTQVFGWRSTIIAFGIFSAIAALVFFLAVREPPREGSAANQEMQKPPPLVAVVRFARDQRSLLHIAAGFCILNATDFMLAGWATPFFVRSYGMDLGPAGSAYAFALAAGGIPGTLLGGYLLDHMARRDLRWHCWLCLGAGLATLPLSFLVYLAPSPLVATAAMTVTVFSLALTYAAGTALPFGLASSRMRGVIYAVYSIGLYVGWGLGPVFVGYVSTRLEPIVGADSLRYALITGAILFACWAAAHFIFASRTYVADCRRARAV